MRIVYALLSPTFGMHQYTAHYANMLAEAGHDVHVVTTRHAVVDRYATAVGIHTPVNTSNTGLSLETLRWADTCHVMTTITTLKPDLVHFSGPHLWNVPIMRHLKKHNIPVTHTLHDLDPHTGTRFGSLLHLWNRAVMHSSDQILVHGQCYRQRLLAQGVAPTKVTTVPLLHLFLSHQQIAQLSENPPPVSYEPFALFFGRLEKYKGVDDLLTAYARVTSNGHLQSPMQLVLAGCGELAAPWQQQLPTGVERHNRLIADQEALDLFRRCSLVVLPYIDATQSALVAAAYYFQKPVLVTRSGALPEYVLPSGTGFLVDAGNPAQLAEALQAAFGQPQQLQEMGRNGRIWYDNARQAEAHIINNMYRQITNVLV